MRLREFKPVLALGAGMVIILALAWVALDLARAKTGEAAVKAAPAEAPAVVQGPPTSALGDTAEKKVIATGGFVYPVGKTKPTHALDGDGYYVAREYLSSQRAGMPPDESDTCLGEDWNSEGGGDTDLGDPVYAAAAGRVTYAEVPDPCWGQVVVIEHHAPPDQPFQLSDGSTVSSVWTLYAHFSAVAVKAGDIVHRGQRIGAIGAGCCSCKAHLHFEVILNPTGPFPGPGYYTPDICPEPSCGRTDPTDFLDLNRQAPSTPKQVARARDHK